MFRSICRPVLVSPLVLAALCLALMVGTDVTSLTGDTLGVRPCYAEEDRGVVQSAGAENETVEHLGKPGDHDPAMHQGSLAEKLSVISVLPFALLLLAIAIMPLVAHRWWESLRNRALVTVVLSLPIGIFLIMNGWHELAHSMIEYFAFIALLGSLFVISGGIVLSGDVRATPMINTAFLAVGAVLANIVGTTGASMLLIRPFLSTNSEREKARHLPIFFIFVVSNIGGCLTPLGDPPLFLGYLRGVPFTWTFSLFPQWLFTVGLLLAIFYVVDSFMVRKESREALRLDMVRINPISLTGLRNFILLAGVIGSVFIPMPWRAFAMIGLAAASYFVTPRRLHLANRFSFFPINEVAILFAGIFITVVPALVLLEANGASFGIDKPWQFFWLTGSLSAFLDNAPTYLTFTSLALGLFGMQSGGAAPLLQLVNHPEGVQLLKAISLGAVFCGAFTYIGNGPNFMVKSIVEQRRIPMPSFFGFMLWSIGILVPVFLAVNLLFL